MENYRSKNYDTSSERSLMAESAFLPWWEYESREDNGLLESLNQKASKIDEDMKEFWSDALMYNKHYEEDPRYYNRWKNRNRIAKSWNLIRVVVDSHFNRIAKIRPKVSFLTKGAMIKISQLAKKADDWILHLFNTSGIYEEQADSYKDACVANLGVVKFFPKKKGKTFGFKRLIPYSFGVELPFEGSTSRDEFLEISEYKVCDIIDSIKGKDAEKIKKELEVEYRTQDDKEKIIKIFTIYKKKYKTAIFTERVVLKYENWKYDWVPYLFNRWDKKQAGIVGTGPAEVVTPCQRKINGLLYRVDKNTNLFGTHYVILPKNSDFQTMSNDHGQYFESNMGQEIGKPIHMTPQIMHPQIFQHLEDTWRKGMLSARLDQIQSEGQMPKGLSQPSGKALAYYDGIDSSKFFVAISMYEDNFVKAARRIIEWGCDLYPSEEPFRDIKADKALFMRSVNKFTGSIIPETPAGRYQVLSQLVGLQVITREKFLELLDQPDITGYLKSESARVSSITKYLEERFFNGQPATPDPVMGYREQREIVLKIYARIASESMEGWDDERLDMIRTFLKQIKDAQEQIKIEQTEFAAKSGIPTANQTGADQAKPDPNLMDKVKPLALNKTG